MLPLGKLIAQVDLPVQSLTRSKTSHIVWSLPGNESHGLLAWIQ